MYAHRRLGSAWASAKSDQSLRCLHEEILGPKLPNECTAKTLSDWADAQADPSLPWVHSHFVGFVMSRLICSYANLPPSTCPNLKKNPTIITDKKSYKTVRKHYHLDSYPGNPREHQHTANNVIVKISLDEKLQISQKCIQLENNL